MPDRPVSVPLPASVTVPRPYPRPHPCPWSGSASRCRPCTTPSRTARAHRKERLAGALRLLGRLGYEDGVAGQVTARDPEFEDCYWVNPFGRAFAALTADDLLLVDGDGRVVRGGRRVNQLAFAVHAAVHRRRPEVVAVVARAGPVRTRAGGPRRTAGPGHPGGLRLLRGPRAAGRVRRGGGRRRRPDRARARPVQGADPAQPRAADGRGLGGRRGLVVHRGGAGGAGAADRPGGGQAGADRAPGRGRHPRAVRVRSGRLGELPAAGRGGGAAGGVNIMNR